ncbi:hypothetical protein ACFYRY_24870 [Streptomyces sp. NPDC005263]|uniref:hypothetical protein n=1 Tax=Streptomyces sp. NPDC005263 TaxID=3364711 RepID=UPI0036C1FEDF
MRSTRMLLATAAASAVLAITAPGAYAADQDPGHEDSSYSKEKEHGKDHGDKSPHGGMHTGGGALTTVNEDDWGKEHGKDHGHKSPHGGMHTGGGALTTVNEDDWGTAKDPKYDPETYKDKDKEKDGGYKKESSGGYEKESSGGYEKDSSGEHHGKPHGGVHTGGGALATPGMTGAGMAVLGVAATGLYAARRRSAGTAA